MGKAIGGNAVIERRIATAQGLSSGDGHALAGFVDAEGCFQIRPNNRGRTWSCRMSVALRLDDADVLTDLCRVVGLGRISMKSAQGTSQPQACWNVASKRECAELTRILRTFPLRARKRHDFEIWARAVDRWVANPYDTNATRAFHTEISRRARDAATLRKRAALCELAPPALDGLRRRAAPCHRGRVSLPAHRGSPIPAAAERRSYPLHRWEDRRSLEARERERPNVGPTPSTGGKTDVRRPGRARRRDSRPSVMLFPR
jgi:hypothetical protein